MFSCFRTSNWLQNGENAIACSKLTRERSERPSICISVVIKGTDNPVAWSMEGRASACELFQAELQLPLACHMLPKLTAKDLGRLACSCKSGSVLVAQADLASWQRIAAEILPNRHPARTSSEVTHKESMLDSEP